MTVGGSANVLSWFLNPTDLISYTQHIAANQTSNIIYMWDTPKEDKLQSIYQNSCTCMVFLTFFGVFHELDGTTTPYAQTIPFEAAITVT